MGIEKRDLFSSNEQASSALSEPIYSNEKVAMMRTMGLIVCLFSVALSGANSAQAEVDQSPLAIDIVPAFPQLQWPDWLTGADSGRVKQLLPLALTGANDGSGRMFVVTQYGRIFSFDNSPEASELNTFLDINERVRFEANENEEGLLGLAFHPKFAENGQFFVYYTPRRTDASERRSVISRFHVSQANPNQADPESEEVLMTISQPYWNHNGGTIVFGPDGYLYVGLGDGGKFNDPHMHGQNLQSLLGSILRIDVDGTTQRRNGGDLAYAIPSDNPFANRPNFARPEIWAYGLRNVWRMSFDRETGTCWAADVGQNSWEEINIIRPGGNYGWNLREAKHSFGPWGSEPREDLVEPIWEYGRKYGKSITGGFVYRGKRVPELYGAYLYADYVSGHIWALWYDESEGRVVANRTLREQGSPVMTFGEDDEGEVYFSSPLGEISKFVSPGVAN